MLEIVSLADRPDLIPIVAEWHWNVWGVGFPGGSLEMWTEATRQRSGRDGIPVSWVALASGMAVGSVGLVADDMATHPELSPWLSSLFVVPELRRRGVGAELVRHCEAAAWALGVGRLYLYTATTASLYLQLGWRPIVTERYRAEEVTIMAKDTSPDTFRS